MSKIEEALAKASRARDRAVPALTGNPLPARPPQPHYSDDDEAHLRDYLEVLLRRKAIILAFLAAVVLTTVLASFIMKPIYQSTAIIHFKSKKANIVEFKDAFYERTNSEYYETQYKILKSRTFLEKVVASLRAPEETGTLKSADESGDASLPEQAASEETAKTLTLGEKARAVSLGHLYQDLEIVPVKKSQLLQIIFSSHDPEMAAHVANTVADEYIEYTWQNKLEPSDLAKESLEKEVAAMKAKLEGSERLLHDFVSKNEMIVLGNDKDYENLLTAKLSAVSQEMIRATSDRISKEAIYEEVRKSRNEYAMVLEDPMIRSLTMEYAKLESEYFDLLKIHKPAYPAMVRLNDKIEKLKARIATEERKIIDTLDSDYKIALKREKNLNSVIQELRGQVTEFQDNMARFEIMKREVDTNRELYDSLLQRMKEVEIAAALTVSDVEILDKAQVPRRPFKPDKVKNTLLAIILGLFGGVFLAFFIEYFDTTVKSVQDIEKESVLPVLGIVPMSKHDPAQLVPSGKPYHGPVPEAFRSICASIQFKNSSKPPKQMLITSPVTKDGKSLCTVNIARSMAGDYAKGIVVDADMRKPKIHKFYDLDNATGLSSYLTSTNGHSPIIREVPGLGFDVITSGPMPANPSDLLRSNRMEQLIDDLSARYDFVIVDSPPILGISDALVLSSFIDNVVLVVRASNTSRDAFNQTIKLLQGVNSNILGLVLNGVDLRMSYGESYYSADTDAVSAS